MTVAVCVLLFWRLAPASSLIAMLTHDEHFCKEVAIFDFLVRRTSTMTAKAQTSVVFSFSNKHNTYTSRS